jgi:transposase-like protein
MSDRTRRIYTAKQKITAVSGCLKLGIARYHRKTGIPRPTLNVWLKQHRAGFELKRTGKRGKVKKAAGVELTRVFVGSQKIKRPIK